MRLPLFQLIEDTIAILERRRDFYRECAYELQEFLSRILKDDALLGVNGRVKGSLSLQEKILRKRIYLKYDNAYDLLANLSDLVGLRAECRFLSEERTIYNILCAACKQRHEDGSYSAPQQPNIRFFLDAPQPERQQNGLDIYRIDGRYHKNGVCTPFEVQIKALVHVFWAEVEHQLIYKNNSYQLVDVFMKKLLYSTYTNLEQVDHHLQLIFDQMQRPTTPDRLLHNDGLEPLLAKTISDMFFRRMEQQMGFSLRLRSACDILSHYMLQHCQGAGINDSFMMLYRRVAAAANAEISFEEALELEGVFSSDDPFVSILGNHLLRQWNTDYDWNLFFRMLFALEPGNNLEDFNEFLCLYRARFADDSLYLPLFRAWGMVRTEGYREELLELLAGLLVENGEITILHQDTMLSLEGAISEACTLLAEEMAQPDITEQLLRQALQNAVR